MATEGGEFLVEAATYLGAAAIAVPLFNRAKLGSILGYLTAGVIIGPSVLNLLDQEEGVFHIAELGVVLFLFLVGLELSLPRLWALRKDIFGLGFAQMAATGCAIAGLLLLGDAMSWQSSLIAGLALAFSSTAFALQFMKDRGELSTPYGRKAFPVLLFQDLAVVPLLAVLPFLAGEGASEGAAGWMDAAKGVGVVAALIFISRFALDHILRYVAGSGSREAFAAMALFVVAAVAAAVSWAGLSMALGAFLAGVLLAESSYRHQIQTDLEPFRGLLLGLFFISIGMRLELAAIFESWILVLSGAFGLVAVKAAILFGLARMFGANGSDALKIGAVLSQGGEFAFVVLSLGIETALFTSVQATIMSAIVTLSMMLTPFAVMFAGRLSSDGEDTNKDDLQAPPSARGHVIVAGFGRVGQIVSQVLMPAGINVTAIDHNPRHIRNAERFGFKIYYGDASRLDVLMTGGLDDASALILTMDDPSAVNHAVEAARLRRPNLPIMALAHDRMHEIELRPLDATFVVRETLESSLLLARSTLTELKVADPLIEDYIAQFRTRDRERLLAQIEEGPEAGADLMHRKFDQLGD